MSGVFMRSETGQAGDEMGARSGWKSLVARMLLAGVIVVSPSAFGTALADSGRFYLGITGTPEWLDTSYKKTVDNTSPLNMTSQSGKVNRDRGSAAGTGYGFGLLGGYRWPLLDRGRLFLDSEFDIAFHGGSVRGRLKGVGESEGRNQMGESWPDDWSFAKNFSYGLTFKLGTKPQFLQTMIGDSNVYALAGVRRVATRFRGRFHGCFTSEWCRPDEFTSGATTHNENFTAWTSGAGLEKMFGSRLGLRGEVRYTGYLAEDWVSFNLKDEGVFVPVRVDNDEVNLSLTLAWYF